MKERIAEILVTIFGRNMLYLLRDLFFEIKLFFVDGYNRLFKVFKYRKNNTIKLHLGCGGNIKEGFINIDSKGKADLRLDLSKKLPFRNDTVDYVYSEHFFEHLYHKDAVQCLFDYKRILKDKGRLKIVVPDMEKCLKAYLDGNWDHFNNVNIKRIIPEGQTPCLIDLANYGIYQYGEHKYCYDRTKLMSMLKTSGYNDIVVTEFDASEDSEERREHSFYVSASK